MRGAPAGVAAAELKQSAATIAAHRGDAGGADTAVRLARANTFDAAGGMYSARGHAALAEIELWRGEADSACRVVEEALAEVGEAEFLLYSAPLYALGAWGHADRGLRARALRRHAEAEEARAAIATLAERFDSRLAGAAPPQQAAYREQVRAELGRLEDPPDAAPWENAGRMWAALEFRFQTAFCAWREAEALLGGDGDRSRVAALLGAAHRDAEALGARPLLEQVEGLARRARVALDRPREATPAEADIVERTDLSPRELEVLALVAEGRTNREIGSELFISEKTVSVHVSRILTKLGATNRAQAATIAHRLGLPAG
jgi:DNA-binding CsgD family transcriptional regulator